MVVAYHVIFGAYGFWLPNDPRGSWSDFTGAWELYYYGGRATRVHTRHSLAKKEHDNTKRFATKNQLKYPEVKFTGVQARAVGRGFSQAVEKYGYDIFACSIMPEHVHLVIGRYRYEVEKIVQRLKQSATMQLVSENIHPLATCAGPPTPWSKGCWRVYLESNEAIKLAIAYTENNPTKEGKPRQSWNFTKRYTERSTNV